MVSSVLPANIVLYFAAFGSGAYGRGDYGVSGGASSGPLLQVGPFSLPNTGSGWLVLLGAIALAIGVGWTVWLVQKRRHSRS